MKVKVEVKVDCSPNGDNGLFSLADEAVARFDDWQVKLDKFRLKIKHSF